MPEATVGKLSAVLTIDTAQFEAGTKKAATATSTLGQSLDRLTPQAERMVKAFGGDKILEQANSLTAAVQKMGGVSRLTQAEQTRVNRTVTEAIEKYRALGQQAPAALLELEKATRRVQAPTQALSGITQGLTTRMVALGAAVGSFVGNVAVGAIQKFGQGLLTAASNGAKFTAIESSFRLLAKSVGESSDAILNMTRSATKGLISDLALMQSANKAVLLGLPVTAQEMATLGKTAVTLGRAMGLDATTALDNLITALGRSSPLILDNLGLTVKLGEATEAYARTLGKTSNELTEAERKMAFYRAAMEAAERKTAELGEVTLGVVDQLNRIVTASANAATTLASDANESRTFAGALGEIATQAEAAVQFVDDLAEARKRLGLSGGVFSGLLTFENPVTGRVATEIAKIQAERVLALATSGTQHATPKLQGLPPLVLPSVTAAELRAIEDAAKKVQDRFAEMAKLSDAIFGRDVIARARDMAAAIGSLSNLSKLSPEKLDEVHRAVADAIGVYERLGQQAPASLKALAAATLLPIQPTRDLTSALLGLPTAIKATAVSLDAELIPSMHGLAAAFDATARAKENLDRLTQDGFVPPTFDIQSEGVTGEAANIARENLQSFLDEQRERIEHFWQAQLGQLSRGVIDPMADLLVGLGRKTTEYVDGVLVETGRMKNAMIDIWQSIRQSIANILSGMLQDFIGANLGQRLGSLLGGGSGGGGGGGGSNVLQNLAGPGLIALGSRAVPGALPTLPSALPSTPGLGPLMNPAFWTNPWTLGIGATIAALSWGIGKKGLFRGGEEGTQVNPRRDQFVAQVGGGPAMAAKLTRMTGEPGGGPLYASLLGADSLKEFRAAQANIAHLFGSVGIKLKSFSLGGFVPPNVNQLAMLHGGRFGEDIIPRTSAGGRSVDVHQNIYVTFNSQALNGDGVRQVWQRDILPQLKMELRTNQNDLLTTLNQVKP